MLYYATLAPRPLNVDPQRSRIPNNKINIKTTHPKPQVEKKENNFNSLIKDKEAEDTLEVQICHGVKVVKQALLERGAHTKRSFRCNAQPVKEIKMEKEMFQAESFTDTIEKPADSIRMDSLHVANIKNNKCTQAELLNSAELELFIPTPEKLLMGNSLSQARESNVPNNGNDTREISCGELASKLCVAESELGLYSVVKDSETSTDLQVTFLQSSDSVKRSFVSRPEGKKKNTKIKEADTSELEKTDEN